VAWQFLYFARSLGELEPSFSDCPSLCPDDIENTRDGRYCETCPRYEAEIEFKEQCEHYLQERTGDQWRKYGFKNLLNAVLDVRDLKGLPRNKLTAITGDLLNILESERGKMERIDEWNRRQKAKT